MLGNGILFGEGGIFGEKPEIKLQWSVILYLKTGYTDKGFNL
jgi:hypothetical protein